MGAGIAHLFAKKGKDVRLKDISLEAIEKGMYKIFTDFNFEKKRKRLSSRFVSNSMHHISFTTTNKGFKNPAGD
ncbi:MAG: 3-hydroxyacyl-CoA dehydrogenase NAD-binding domain-containing protein [Bdellovibrionota bacterium]